MSSCLRLVFLLLVAAGPAAAQATAPTRVATPPPAAATASAIHVPYTQFTLPNGLHVILHQDRRVPVVAVNTWYHVGSAHEKVGRTGFAHLFEHLMFMGSGHVKQGLFDTLLESAGGQNNGSTENDRTNYIIDVPSNTLELALYLESDRMGYLLGAMSPQSVDAQRDVVKNERRQSYENRPYGVAELALGEMLYPDGHPYHWPTIGYMEDLSAASYQDVVEFFKKYYAPNNASLVVAGDIDLDRTRTLVEKWFGEIPRGEFVPPLAPPAAYLTEVKRRTIPDRVQLPRLYLAWLTPAQFQPGDAAMDLASAVLSGGKNSRLYKRLVYDLQIAQDVEAFQESGTLGSSFTIVATARPGTSLDELQKVIDEELDRLRQQPPEPRELERAVNQMEAAFYRQMERVGGFRGKANQLNAYYTSTGMPDYFAADLGRYRVLSAVNVQAAIQRYLPRDRRVELSVVPQE